MSPEAVLLAKEVLAWWEDAQYDCCGEHNIFDSTPNFVWTAKRIVEDAEVPE